MSAADITDIVEVLNGYAVALDAHRWDLFAELFTQDVNADFGPAGATWTNLHDFTQSFAAFHATLDDHQHTMAGHVVRVDGDDAQAFSYGTWLLVRNAAEGGASWRGNGWYDDELVRTENGWRIRNRTCRLVSWSGNPRVPEPIDTQEPRMDTHALHLFAEAGEVRLLQALGTSGPARHDVDGPPPNDDDDMNAHSTHEEDDTVNGNPTSTDTVEIVQTLNLYGLAVDARRWSLFDGIFVRDVEADFGPAGATWSNRQDFKRGLAEFCDTLDNHQHTMMGHVVRVAGDEAQAFTYGSWLLVRESAEGGPSWHGNGWYDDHLVRTAEGWRIRARTCRLSSWSGNPRVSQPTGDQSPDMATNVLHEWAAAGRIHLLDNLGHD